VSEMESAALNEILDELKAHYQETMLLSEH
jgi:hypothetical protein